MPAFCRTYLCNQNYVASPGRVPQNAIMAITLRPSDEQITLIEKLKRILQVGTASKALFAAAYPKLKDELEREKQKSLYSNA